MAKVAILKMIKFPTWESWGKCHLGVTPMVNHKKYYKREGGGFFQIQAVVSLVSSYMPMVHLCTKSVPIMH
jgi:hypothetical protein